MEQQKGKQKSQPEKEAKQAGPKQPNAPVAAPARKFKRKKRHLFVGFSFLVFVALPLAFIYFYLSNIAEDQFESNVGFTVRTEETNTISDAFGSLGALGSSNSSDADILYEFIQSQEMVQTVRGKIDLVTIYSKPKSDFIFGFDPNGSIEDLVEYWQRMVKIYYDSSTGLISLRVLAFTPEDALNISKSIVEASTVKINALSAISRQDSTRYAKDDLDVALQRLKTARRALTGFRNKHQIVDPEADISAKVGLLNSLQLQLAEALINFDLVSQTTSSNNDARVEQIRRRINIIQDRIKEERKQFSLSESADGEAFSTIVGQYEELRVDMSFAEQAYLSALSAFNAAKAEAQRQSRYLAAYIQPTLAERSTFPQSGNIMTLSALFLFLFWAIAVLLGYAIKDRR